MTDTTKIAFYSCCRREGFEKHFPGYKKAIWGAIKQLNPDYLFTLGDTIYMDYGLKGFSKDYNGKPKKMSPQEFEKVMSDKYYLQFEDAPFKQLVEDMKEKGAFHGVWDDHDFAWNGACGAEMTSENDLKKKAISLRLFKEYIGSTEEHEGIYKFIDTPNARVFFLDCRYFAQPPTGLFKSNKDRRMLGNAQRQYVENNIDHDRTFTIFCSGLTFYNGSENWSKFGKFKHEDSDLRWISNLIKAKNLKAVFLAGDIHKNKFHKPGVGWLKRKRPCYEIISSGLAINYLGLPVASDNCHNWGILETSEEQIKVTLINKSGVEIERTISLSDFYSH